MSYPFRLTNKAIRILDLHSVEEAKRLNHDMLTPEHVLLGIFHETDSIVVNVLNKLKIDIEKIKFDIESSMVKSTSNTKLFGKIPPSPRIQHLISRAAEEAKSLGDNCISTEHLLLGILKEENGIAYNVLTSYNLDLKTLRHEMMRIRGKSGSSSNISESSSSTIQEDNTARTPTLDKFARDLTKMAREKALDRVIGRENEVMRVVQILSRRKKNNPILLGEPGVGKTAIVEGLAEKIVSTDVPDILLKKRVLSLDLSSVVAGTKYRGEFEERIKNIVMEIKKVGNIIIFIDELHTLIGAGGAEGALDAANMLKPALSRGEIQCIGATTINEYKKYIEKDGALVRRFQPINVEEPSIEDTIEILNGIKSKYEEHHKVKYTDGAIYASAVLSKRYIFERHLPDKAIDLIDEAGSRARLMNMVRPQELKDLENKIKELNQEKETVVKNQNFEEAVKLRDAIKSLQEELDKKEAEWRSERDKTETIINEDDIRHVISEITNIPVKRLLDSESKRLIGMEDELHSKIVGQKEAISSISKAIRRARAGLKSTKKPLGSFIFLGPTGVGKTALAKVLSEFMFGDSDALIRIDMSEFMEKFAVSRLIGAPPGYVGYEEGGGLTEKVRRKPYSLILFDEIEKAHPDITNILLQVLEEGQLTDNFGRKVDFSNTIIIITSNLGARDIVKGTSLGFNAIGSEKDINDMKNFAMEELKQNFNPEFLNRIDDIIVFHTLTKEDLKDIIEIMLRELNEAIKDRNIFISLTDDAKNYIIDKGFDKKYGARSLRRAIQKEVEDYISTEILFGHIEEGDNINVDSDGQSLLFNVEKVKTYRENEVEELSKS
ncbi:ATP-dependent Clp protease ATP-binding subunit [Brachyspira pilosicoli]|uniref:Hemolysin B n=3 Tax=Brachyspira pilosicoli TaxID=52584 RepID=A0A3B6VKR2_BRAPL|nr:ATP-dependent Clp protease ATP-binding subunit [Brachyspira pilosicoli]AGA66476.1 hemolysin B [Brachyspira pilosicoli P43/6/78]MBW5381824.1 ATP-dependent Clp protease ATP-binding subunit [Brachyspira pilosicoli]MBW5391125.1 ATP-dependent Clp protease ATP-binding subunit [Brachyspira pilosicoli]MBW5398702.1 ATP-dependent Clp protease ATP-binding subunit [Brachyspira pilosicoli]PLV64017.1 ATP-dependent Clp protease ATP-binding protein [Brachyspira pilosicoli SP16]